MYSVSESQLHRVSEIVDNPSLRGRARREARTLATLTPHRARGLGVGWRPPQPPACVCGRELAQRGKQQRRELPQIEIHSRMNGIHTFIGRAAA